MCLKEIKVFKKTGSKELPHNCGPLEDDDLSRTFEVFLASFFCWGRSEMKVSPPDVFFPTWGYSSSNDTISDNPQVFAEALPFCRSRGQPLDSSGLWSTVKSIVGMFEPRRWKEWFLYGNPLQTNAFSTYQSPLFMGQGLGWLL